MVNRSVWMSDEDHASAEHAAFNAKVHASIRAEKRQREAVTWLLGATTFILLSLLGRVLSDLSWLVSVAEHVRPTGMTMIDHALFGFVVGALGSFALAASALFLFYLAAVLFLKLI